MLKEVVSMKQSKRIFEKDTKQALLGCLKDIPFLKVREAQRPKADGPNLVLKVGDGSEDKTLVVEIKDSGQPRIAREGVNQLLLYLQKFPKSYGILAAPYISPRSAEICTQNGIGYVDLAGNCLITFENIFIKKEGGPNPFARKRELRSLYSPRAERVLRVLLNQPKRIWKIQELAKEANVSLGQCHNVKELLANREWITFEDKGKRKGYRVSEPLALLNEWADNYDFRKNRVMELYSAMSVAEIEKALFRDTKQAPNCALAGFSAAARLGTASRYQRVMAFASEEAVEAL